VSEYVNVGAFIDGRRAPSKKALKIALADAPERVHFDTTSALGPSAEYTGLTVPEGVSLQVVGPDPYADRRFYATVKINSRTGKVVLS
jgi:hypothetical protein